MYYKIYLRNYEGKTEFATTKNYTTLDEAKADRITLQTFIKLPEEYYFEIQEMYN